MFSKKVFFYLGSLALIINTTPSWAANGSGSGPRCDLLLGKSSEPLSQEKVKRRTSLEKSKKSSLVLIDLNEQKLREVVDIRDGQKQSPPRNTFGSDYISNYYYHQDVLGDRIRVQIFPLASPFSSRNPYNQSQNQISRSGDNHQQLQNGYRTGSQVTTTLSQGQSSNNNSYQQKQRAIQLAPSEKYQIAKAFALTQFAQKPSQSSLDLVVETILRSPELLETALRHRQAIQNVKTVELANYGENRYFWFIPEGQSEHVAARILDIHRNSHPESFVILAEYIKDVDPVTGVRIRQIFQLREAEFKTIQEIKPNEGRGRREAAEEFYLSLTPDETQTLKLAQKLKLKLFGYFDFQRGPGKDGPYSSTPLEEMTALGHLAVRSHIESTFGKVDDLMTAEERGDSHRNIIDIFSRLNPRYVMKRFGGPKGSNTRYDWVITEDGQLKVIPGHHRGGNLKSTLLRLAAGRKIFAGGDFYLNPDESVEIVLNGYGYQEADVRWGSTNAYQEQNPHVNEFVKIVFGLQMGRIAKGIRAQQVDSWIRADQQNESFRDSSQSHFEYQRQSQSDSSSFDEFVRGMSQRARKSVESDGQDRVEIWNLENGKPMNLSEFAIASGQAERSPLVQSEWAHYVLQTNTRMTWDEIKRQYRKLAMRFHPDRNSETRAVDVMQKISLANQIREGELKP
jgi:hypothetical protein